MAARDVSDVWARAAARAAGHAAATTHVPTHAPHAAAPRHCFTWPNARSMVLRLPSPPSRARRSRAHQLPSVPSLTPNSRATCAIGPRASSQLGTERRRHRMDNADKWSCPTGRP
ncbi:putative immunity protein [Amycolatopsis sp. MtRt-6]|uniref:putative immunity protein n=1 Tax=Amycolatopsis sp. MtRt-6 TaxID=2792782 RepID=UPI0035ABAD41